MFLVLQESAYLRHGESEFENMSKSSSASCLCFLPLPLVEPLPQGEGKKTNADGRTAILGYFLDYHWCIFSVAFSHFRNSALLRIQGQVRFGLISDMVHASIPKIQYTNENERKYGHVSICSFKKKVGAKWLARLSTGDWHACLTEKNVRCGWLACLITTGELAAEKLATGTLA